MDYENFKEALMEGLKENFYESDMADVKLTERGTVDKLNGGYDGIVATPEGSRIGVTLNVYIPNR